MKRMSGRLVEPPPVPADSLVCRWCTGKKVQRQVGGRLVCAAGCLVAPVYASHCDDCKRPYETGQSRSGRQCWTCRDREHARTTAEFREGGRPVTGYMRAQTLAAIDQRVVRERRAS